MSQFVDRMIRTAQLDSLIYEEVETNTSAMGQAMGVVVLSRLVDDIVKWVGRLFMHGYPLIFPNKLELGIASRHLYCLLY